MNRMPKQHRNVSRDVLLCVGIGLGIATLFSVYVLTLRLVRGDEPFARLETSLGAVILLYFAAAILVGVLVGLLLPFARAARLGAALVGFVGGSAFYAMVRVTLEGMTSWTSADAIVIVGCALFIGVPVGLIYRRIFADGS